MGKFKEYLKEQYMDIKGVYNHPGGETSIKGSRIGAPPAIQPRRGIDNLRLGMEALNGWMQPKAVAKAIQITNWFGVPNVLTNSKAMWFKIAGMDKVIVKDEAVVNQYPEFHVEMVYGTKRTPVPPEFQTPLAAVSQSFMFDGLKKEVTYRCRDIIGCAIALGFAQDVVDGEAEPTLDELAMRFENIEIPQWFDISVKQWMDYELVKDQGVAWKKEIDRTGGKYGRGYHWKLGKVPMDMEQDLNIKEDISEGKVSATWKNGSLSWKANWKHKSSAPGQLMVSSGPRWKTAPSEKDVKKHLEKVLGKSFTLEYKVNEGKDFGVHLIKNPKGTWSFKGSIPVELGWVNKDGSELTPEQAKEVARSNQPALLAKTRVFKTPAEARKMATKYKVKKIQEEKS